MFQSKIPQAEQGFTFLEVLVAMLIVTVFLFASLQMMVMMAMVTTQARVRREANNWIDSDIKEVLHQAEELPGDISRCSASNYNSGYARALIAQLSFIGNPTTITTNYVSYDSFTNLLNPQQISMAQKRGGVVQKSIRLTRFYESYESSPKVLRIRYQVEELDVNGNPVQPLAEQYIDVIPNVALVCPEGNL